jgi:uncharacterized protein
MSVRTVYDSAPEATRMKIDEGTTALVTGANGGIGAAIARSLAAKGAKVILSGRRAAALEPLAAELGAQARIIVADLATREGVDRLCAEAGPVDIAVLNAALPAAGELFDLDPDAIQAMVQVNLTTPILMARALGLGMAARGAGQIVMISSISGHVPAPASSLYCATKFGLRGFALSLRGELAARGVGVTTIYPGFIRDAGMFASTGAKLPRGIGTRSPADVAAAVLRSVRRNPAEITVAALDQRFAARLAALFPSIGGLAARSSAARRLTAEVVEGHKVEARRRSDAA